MSLFFIVVFCVSFCKMCVNHASYVMVICHTLMSCVERKKLIPNLVLMPFVIQAKNRDGEVLSPACPSFF